MQRLTRVLFERVPPLWWHAILLWLFAVLPNIGISGLANLAAFTLQGETSSFGQQHGEPWVSAFQSMLFAPFVETLLLCVWIEAAVRLGQKRLFIAIGAGVIAGLLHAIVTPIWFFTSAWAFFVYACGYLAWRPHSFPSAFIAAALAHALNNATGVALLFVLARFA